MENKSLDGAFENLGLRRVHQIKAVRREELDALINALSNHEIRYLRGRLDDITLQKDICAELPVELLLQVAKHVELEDILRFRSVSRAWHEAFANVDFCNGLAQEHFPALSTREFAHQVGQDGLRRVDHPVTIQDAILRRVRLRHGCYTSRAVYSYGTPDKPIDFVTRQQYCQGRFAFQAHSYGIKVICLKTNAGVLCTEPDRARISVWCLSDKYLVIGRISPPSLHAFSLNSDEGGPDSSHSVRLPSRPMEITGRSDLFGIITQSRTIHLWRVGGNLKVLPSPSPTDHGIVALPSASHIIFTPAHTGFAVTQVYAHHVTPVVKPNYIAIDLYEDENNYTHHEVEISVNRWHVNARDPSVTGDHAFAWKLFPTQKLSEHASATDKTVAKTIHVVEALTFDVVKRAFSFKLYCVPLMHNSQIEELLASRGHLWRDQLIFPSFSGANYRAGNVLKVMETGKPIVIGMRPYNKSQDACHPQLLAKDITKLAEQERGQLDISSNKWTMVTDSYLMQDAFRVSTVDDSMNAVQEQYEGFFSEIKILGDDDFIVLSGSRDGMVVWCFNKTISLCTTYT